MARFLLATVLLCPMVLSHTASAADWQPAQGPLLTRWAKEVSPKNVHSEYPRPQLVREKWTNLNGLWDYAVVGRASGLPEKWDGQILVPFPIESALSGVMQRVAPADQLWYRRMFQTPELKNAGRLLLHFGAVDWHCEVFVNGKSVGTHTGGYDPFTFDITDSLATDKAEQELVVKVSDPTDTNWQPRGKQVVNPKGIWYTPTTGIWQTVWLEAVPETSIESLHVVPDVDNGLVRVTVHARGGRSGQVAAVSIYDAEQKKVATEAGEPGRSIVLKVPQAKLWSPDAPNLYYLGAAVSQGTQAIDTAESYFAMRKISLGKDKDGVTRMLLNNQPLFQWGPLDQGFWPDGLYTAPTDAAMKYDLEVTKQLGFNMIRKHVKVEPARWYHYCDQLGILVWQDMPSGDKHAPWNPFGLHNGKEIERSQESADNFRNEWKAIMDDLRHFPSIVCWVPFNEAWGQFDTVAVTNWTMQHDPTRLVNCASGGNDFPAGHISDLHRYPGPIRPPLESSRASVLGEFGGLGLPLEGHTWQGKNNWGYRSFETKAALNDAYAQLIRRLRPLIGQGLSAAIYTQTTDVEVEVNGFLTYDREVIKLDPEKTAALHKTLFLPPPKEVVIIPTAREAAQTWRYTTDQPADGWEKPDFSDASWKEGAGGFGEPSTPGSKVRTTWKTPDIWLRRTIELPSDKLAGLALNIHHDEDTEVYLNGILVFSAKGHITDYALVPLGDKLAAAARPGANTLAIHTHQTGGGQYIDCGLVRLEERK
jgi:Glycosyl hydrolases family 2, sugar binding domain/Glycosyl hydrolases family 2, TIM barrel domain/Glycosyl hydrolases family 2